MKDDTLRVAAVVFAVLVIAGIGPLTGVVSAADRAPHQNASDRIAESTTPSVEPTDNDGGDPVSEAVFDDAEYAEASAATSTNGVRSYSRYDESSPLDNETRATVHDAVVGSPGLSLSALSERTDVPRSTVRYHVRILQEEGLIRTDLVRGKHRVYPANDDDPELAASLNDDAASAVLEAVAEEGPASVTALADALDRTPGTVSYHLDRLHEAGLVERERAGNAVVTTLPDRVRSAMAAD